MEAEPLQHSFSRGRRWGIFFSVLISMAAALAIFVMLNYLGARHSLRFFWSAKTAIELSPRTVSIVKSLTNQVKIIVYCDQSDLLYPELSALLKEYTNLNANISRRNVDPLSDALAAQKVTADFHLGARHDKNLLIISSPDRQPSIIPIELLAPPKMEAVVDDSNGDGRMKFVRHLDEFNGERILDGYLLAIANPTRKLACFLQGHGEASLGGQGDFDYREFADILLTDNFQPQLLNLSGTNLVPADCSVLIIAGPQDRIPPDELVKISAYLNQGGRLLVLFNYGTSSKFTGLEELLYRWGMRVGMNTVEDSAQSTSSGTTVIKDFNRSPNEAVSALNGRSMFLIKPRSITALPNPAGPADNSMKIVELAWTSPSALIQTNNSSLPSGQKVPVMAAVERSRAGTGLDSGVTRIIAVGDSLFLGNIALSQSSANGDFANLALEWLTDQFRIVNGVGPRKMLDYRVTLTRAELTNIRWIFLAGMPGAVLLFGGLVWLRRRH